MIKSIRLPGGPLKKPNPSLEGDALEELKKLLDSFEVTKKYKV